MALGLFDESLQYSEDHDWFLRAREAELCITIIPEVTLIYRLHEGNMTRDLSVQELALAGVLKRSLDRRRASSWPLPPARLRPWTDFDEGRARRSER